MLNNFKKSIIIACAALLIGCQADDKSILKVGTISGPETQLMEVAKEVAKTQGLNIKIVEFTDYIEPNSALNDGSIDANMFQHQPFLDQQITDRKYKLVSVAKTFVYPMGVYSKKIKRIQDIANSSIVAIPNDPSNEGRALILLQKAGLIRLNDTAGLYATPADITENPKKLEFKELDAAQLARSLNDVTIAVINTNFAIPAGLTPTKDAIIHEGRDSLYANIVVIRENETNDPRIKQLISALQSPEVLKKAKELFKGQAIPAWQSQP
jgi:D-methionine transport system substrate-binding protein